MPFVTLDNQADPPVELKQVGAKQFKLLKPFKYRDPTSNSVYQVPIHDPEDLTDVTDLASVPPFLWWFIASYGHQTRAALLHDHLVRGPVERREEADRIFRVALSESGVGIPRRWMMWTAVSLLTLLKTRPGLFALMCLHVAVGFMTLILGTALLLGLSGPAWDLPAIVWMTVPLLTSFVWVRRWPIYAIGTYAAFALAPALVTVGLTTALSALVSRVVDGEWTLVPYRHDLF